MGATGGRTRAQSVASLLMGAATTASAPGRRPLDTIEGLRVLVCMNMEGGVDDSREHLLDLLAAVLRDGGLSDPTLHAEIVSLVQTRHVRKHLRMQGHQFFPD